MFHFYLRQFAVTHTLHMYESQIWTYLAFTFESWRTLPQTFTKILDPMPIHPTWMFPFVAFVLEIFLAAIKGTFIDVSQCCRYIQTLKFFSMHSCRAPQGLSGCSEIGGVKLLKSSEKFTFPLMWPEHLMCCIFLVLVLLENESPSFPAVWLEISSRIW